MTLKKGRLNHTQKASLIIVVAGLISKILAAIYRIPYQNIVGDRGFYAYQQIYPLIGIISTLGLVAFPNIISSLAQKQQKTTLGSLFQLEALLSGIGAILLIVLSGFLAQLMGASQLKMAIQIVGVILLLVPFISFYRGLAQSTGNMQPTAVSQVIEQAIRISVIILAAVLYGVLKLSIYQTATIAVSGNLLASIITLIYLIKKAPISLKEISSGGSLSLSAIKHIGFPSLVFLFFSIYLLLFQLVDAFLVKNALVAQGMSNSLAEIEKGIFDRGQPLIQFGLIFSTALFTTYLPKLTRYYHQNKEHYHQENQLFFSFIFYFNSVITIGFLTIFPQMNRFLFKNNLGAVALMLYLLIILLASLIQFFHQTLFIEGSNRQSLLYLLIGVVVKILITYPLTLLLGIVGSSLSTVIALILVLSCYLKKAKMNLLVFLTPKFILSLLVMIGLVLGVRYLIPSTNRLTLFVNIILSSLVGASVFLLMSTKWQVFDKRLFSFLPFYKEK
ncbi:oligosaccharide flippase family protein [Streptococcus pacificus]|uniref:Polysaccharide biosynthesis protein n=1 Tax=Streptococcus pacificus TaxID=2740577 RepID=A0ABS0ZJZ8_9STRE|nr:oligosaccharide flippase family protein [Streptococcus pacificus]MBJ8326351.1 polysaccharide biosynthesis protein [Streptococcus pacificus]